MELDKCIKKCYSWNVCRSGAECRPFLGKRTENDMNGKKSALIIGLIAAASLRCPAETHVNEFTVSAGATAVEDNSDVETARGGNRIVAQWGYSHTASFWDCNLDVIMQQNSFDVTGSANIFQNYFKQWMIQPGTSLGIIYHLQYSQQYPIAPAVSDADSRETTATTDLSGATTLIQDGLVTASFYIDCLPTKTRLTFFGGLGLETRISYRPSADPINWTPKVYPVAAVFLTQSIASIDLRLGAASFSYSPYIAFPYTDTWYSPHFFGDIAWRINKNISVSGGVHVYYHGYAEDDSPSFDRVDITTGIKYSF